MEGDPQIKNKIRQKQRELAKKRMMASVPKADVVITNPTTLAVALEYDREASAPRLRRLPPRSTPKAGRKGPPQTFLKSSKFGNLPEIKK